MQLPSSNAEPIIEMIDRISQAIEPLTVSERTTENTQQQPAQVLTSLGQLRDIIQNQGKGRQLGAGEITEIGEYAMQLLGNTGQLLQRFNDIELQQTNGVLAVSISLWVGEHGGQINMLDPLVDTLAWLANHLEDTSQMAGLTNILGKLMDSCSIAISSDLDNTNPGRPWRVLNINRGIVATRSHDTSLMREAFDRLIRNLPVDAAAFFQQGMSEMDRVGYPEHVREVMQEYAQQYPLEKTIH